VRSPTIRSATAPATTARGNPSRSAVHSWTRAYGSGQPPAENCFALCKISPIQADERRHRKSAGTTLYRWEDLPKERLKPDLQRRLISTERLMLAHVYLEKACVVPLHSHENEQLTYILVGLLRFSLGDDASRSSMRGRRSAPHSFTRSHQRRHSRRRRRRHLLSPTADWLDGSDAICAH